MKQAPSLALRRLEIRNFRAIDHLELDFPAPRFADQADIWVLGSKNGLGKTSILEAIALLVLTNQVSESPDFFLESLRELEVNLFDIWVRAGAEKASLKGTFQLGNKPEVIELQFDRGGTCRTKGQLKLTKTLKRLDMVRNLISLAGLSSDPLYLSSLLLFHSYRKVQEGNPELGMLLDRPERIRPSPYYRPRGTISSFKAELLKLMMGSVDLFESIADERLNVMPELEHLLSTYAQAKMGKLRPDRGNTLDIRLHRIDSDPNQSFSFDGLSSGQKEIISTLYLVARYSKSSQGIIGLIDEPELHLNAEWHAALVQDLHRLAPTSQFILASHSEHIFSAVAPERRLLLEP